MRHGGEIYNIIVKDDFSVNLNPMGCPRAVKEAINTAVGMIDRYPDIYQLGLRENIAKLNSVSPGCVLGGNGASELLMAAVRAINPKKALIVAPGFYGYEHCLKSVDCKTAYYYLTEKSGADDFQLGEDFIGRIKEDTNLVILGNPNNPTGRVIDDELMDTIVNRCSETGTSLIIDECFLSLSDKGKSCVKYINDYDYIYVVKAFTKLMSIPGIRVGYLISNEKNIFKLQKMLPEWNMSVIAQEAAIAGAKYLCETDYINESKALIKTQRMYLTDSLKEIGIRTYESDTNFILIYTNIPLYDKLIEKGILIRDASNFAGLTKGFYRIAVKDQEANTRFIEAVKDVTR